MSLVLRIAIAWAGAQGLRTQEQATANRQTFDASFGSEAYTFEEFARAFGRAYQAGSDEHVRRAHTFRDSMLQIHAKNSRSPRSWTAGVHPFMDWTGAERAQLHGYKPSGARRVAKPTMLAVLQARAVASSRHRIYGGAGDSFENEAPPVRSQGACGSCWALASVEAVEARLLKRGRVQLSPQALLDCVQNPMHCGGRGGCDGATPQLAFEFMRDSGLPLEANFPYSQDAAGKCPIKPYPSSWARATLTGWRSLPSNLAQPLMEALVEDGPVVVSVYAHDWYSYRSGIFDDCPKDSVPSHSVLATGYGVLDMSSGTHSSLLKYWLLQNSWGSAWGERGYMRLIRHDDEDGWCGIDSQPQMGSACDDDPHQNVTVCGSCGILYDAVIPQVGGLDIPTPEATTREANKVEAIWRHYQATSDARPQQSTTSMATAQGAETGTTGGPAPNGGNQLITPVLRTTAGTPSQKDSAWHAESALILDADQLPGGAHLESKATGLDAQAQDVAGGLSAMGYHASEVTDAMDAYEAGALQD